MDSKKDTQKNSGKIIEVDFGANNSTEDDIFLEDMNAEQIRQYISDLKTQLAELDALEPDDEESEEYEAWAEEHEDLEDIIDEALDRLDEIDG